MFLAISLSLTCNSTKASSVSSIIFSIYGIVKIVDSRIYLINDIFCEYFDILLLAIDGLSVSYSLRVFTI